MSIVLSGIFVYPVSCASEIVFISIPRNALISLQLMMVPAPESGRVGRKIRLPGMNSHHRERQVRKAVVSHCTEMASAGYTPTTGVLMPSATSTRIG